MAKYSTGDGGSESGETCELCGTAHADLEVTTVAGARLEVCPSCARHGEDDGPGNEDGKRDRNEDGKRDRKRQAARNAARLDDARKGDPEHWVDGADYDDDQLPYLVRNYDERVTEARQEQGLQLAELADELEVPEESLLAVEQGRATQAGVGGSVIGALEERLDVRLAESS